MDRGAWWATVHAVTESDTTEVTWHTQCMYVNSNLPVHPTLPCACLHVHSLCLHLYSCPANRFICVIFLDSIYVALTYHVFHYLTLLCVTDTRSIYITTDEPILFLFMAEQYSIIYMYHIFFIHPSVNI